MPDLSAYLNVYNTALVILQEKGFTARHDATTDDWHAEKDGWTFVADNPIELLGLAAIFERQAPKVKTENWWRIAEPDLLKQLDSET
jgi:hypothetical protein